MVNNKLETLEKQRARIQARIAEEEAKLKSKTRKEDTRLKILVERGITIDRDREFLKTKGWLP
jgi:hypothetical protein